MELEIRQAKPEEMDEFKKVVKAGLMMTPQDNLNSEMTLCAFIDGKMATSYAAWDMEIKVNGGTIPMAGITDVGTLPIYRRLGCLRKVTARHFEILYEEGKQPLSTLYASRAAIYRRYGYSPVVYNCSYTVEPRYIQFIAGKEPKGIIREAGEAEIPVLWEIYNRFIENRTGYLIRSEEMWKRKLNPPARENVGNFCIILEEDGKPQGYAQYSATLIQEGRNRWSQNIFISGLAWNTPSAYRGLWEFFSRMDVIIEVTWAQAPIDDPLFNLLLEPRQLNKTVRDGLLARIIDIQGIMNKRGYDEEGKLTFKVIDDLCPWNEKTWKLETSPEQSTIKPTREKPQLEMPLSTLTLLFFGQLSATEAWRMGRLEVNDQNSLKSWDKVMKTAYRPACADSF
jgi:predicted acetyltransferase